MGYAEKKNNFSFKCIDSIRVFEGLLYFNNLNASVQDLCVFSPVTELCSVDITGAWRRLCAA
jgi:hypothetical protein